MSDIVERLRLLALWEKPGGVGNLPPMPSPYKTCSEAADEIERLRAVVAVVSNAMRTGA